MTEIDVWIDRIPDDLEQAIPFLEAGLRENTALVEANDPGPAGPIGLQIANALRANRLSADGDFIDNLRLTQKFHPPAIERS